VELEVGGDETVARVALAEHGARLDVELRGAGVLELEVRRFEPRAPHPRRADVRREHLAGEKNGERRSETRAEPAQGARPRSSSGGRWPSGHSPIPESALRCP